jgi:hypothetical protein
MLSQSTWSAANLPRHQYAVSSAAETSHEFLFVIMASSLQYQHTTAQAALRKRTA